MAQKEHEDFYHRLTSLFDSLEIKNDILKYTIDFWCRDYIVLYSFVGKTKYITLG